jgi:hypothetical protein
MASLDARALGARISFGLSRELWLIEAGVFLNMLGYGAVLPFEIIYLHNGRGFSLGVAGLVVGTITGVAVVVSPTAGQLIDRFGAQLTAIGAGVALAAGYGGLAFVHTPAEAFAAAACAGAGNGALSPSQTTLLTTLAAPDVRHRVTAVSRVAGNAGIGIGGALGGLVAAHGLAGFVVLFLVNAVTYLVYVAVLAVVVRENPRRDPVRGGYRLVLRDRPPPLAPPGWAVAGSLVRTQHPRRRGDQDGQAGRDQQRVAQADARGGRADGDRADEQAAVGHRRDPADVPPGAGGIQPDRRGDDLREDPGQARAEQREPGHGRRRGADQQPGG